MYVYDKLITTNVYRSIYYTFVDLTRLYFSTIIYDLIYMHEYFENNKIKSDPMKHFVCQLHVEVDIVRFHLNQFDVNILIINTIANCVINWLEGTYIL